MNIYGIRRVMWCDNNMILFYYRRNFLSPTPSYFLKYVKDLEPNSSISPSIHFDNVFSHSPITNQPPYFLRIFLEYFGKIKTSRCNVYGLGKLSIQLTTDSILESSSSLELGILSLPGSSPTLRIGNNL